MHLPAETAMRQAHYTAHEYMAHGRDYIDAMFGKGYAAEHPELLAAFIQTAAMDFATAMAMNIAEGFRYEIEENRRSREAALEQ